MDQTWLHLLLISGFLSLTLCIQPEYILIKQPMTWENAQTYCRTHHTDLATVQSSENWTRLQEAADEQLFTGFAWIGLYNDINSWRWSYNDESLVFKSWASGQPNDEGFGEECTAMLYDGTWNDFSCTDLKYFVCYDDSGNTTEKKWVLKKNEKTWQDAQTFCRDRYTDLAIIRSQADLVEITSLLTSLLPPVWIGLYRDNWKWSDRVNITSSAKLAIQTFTPYNEDCGGADIYYRTTDDRLCTTNYYFYCSTVKKRRQVIRVQVKSGQNVDEAKLQALVLNKLKQTLSNEDVTLTWRTQPKGKVFQKDRTIQKHIEANTTLVCSLGSA